MTVRGCPGVSLASLFRVAYSLSLSFFAWLSLCVILSLISLPLVLTLRNQAPKILQKRESTKSPFSNNNKIPATTTAVTTNKTPPAKAIARATTTKQINTALPRPDTHTESAFPLRIIIGASFISGRDEVSELRRFRRSQVKGGVCGWGVGSHGGQRVGGGG